jgi:hypothetical protein
MIQQKRYSESSAYIDSTLVAAFVIGLIAFATWIAFETSSVINPLWLGGSIIAVGIYEMIIYWLMRQYWDVHRIFIIFIINIVSLGLILGLVGIVFDVRLPVDLPVLNFTLYLSGIEATSFSPGAVALSYTVIGLFSGYVVMLIAMLIENTRPAMKIKQWFKLDRLDYIIDTKLDKHSFFLENTSFFWLVAPIILLVALNVVVVGSASLLQGLHL